MNNIINFTDITLLLVALVTFIWFRWLVKHFHRTTCPECGDLAIVGKSPRLTDKRGNIHFACGSYCARKMKDKGYERLST